MNTKLSCSCCHKNSRALILKATNDGISLIFFDIMVVDIHKVITSTPITKGIMSPWGSNSKANSMRGKFFNKYTGPGNDLLKQVKFDP